MAIPLAVMAGAAALPRLITGLFQSGKKVEEDKFVPPALREQLAKNRIAANSTVDPITIRSIDNVNRNASNAVNTAKDNASSFSDITALLSGVNNNSNRAIQDIMAGQYSRDQVAENNLSQTLGQLSNLQLDSRRRKQAAQSALKGAGLQNIVGAGDSFISNFSSLLGMESANAPS